MQSRWTNIKLRILSVVTTVWSLVGIFVVHFAPVGPEQPEVWMFLFGPVFPLFAILVVMVRVRMQQDTPTKWTKVFWCLIPLLCLPVLSIELAHRTDYVDKLRLEIDGTVIEKYRSRNHAAPSLRIRSANGEVIELDGIESEAWEGISVGDHIRKTGWSESTLVNGRNTRVIAR